MPDIFAPIDNDRDLTTNVTKNEYVRDEDLIPYKDYNLAYGPIGSIVDTRTYLRYLPDLQRRETPLERWKRCINYSLGLVADKKSYDELREEGLQLLDYLVQFKVDFSGRAKWVSGTETTERNPMGVFNCSSSAFNRLSVIDEAFELLLNGCGFGFRVFSKDISQLPKLCNKNVEVLFSPYNPLEKSKRLQNNVETWLSDNILMVKVGDTRESWIAALKIFIDVSFSEFSTVKAIIFDVDSVRPIGERIHGFGGTASGPDALINIIKDIQTIIKNVRGNRLTSVDCSDIICAIAKGVVAGSSRRSALISLFEQSDKAMRNYKKGLYTDPKMAGKSYRSQVNVTACLIKNPILTSIRKFLETHLVKGKPERENLHNFISRLTSDKPSLSTIRKLLETCKTEGEPGFNNWSKIIARREEAAKRWRPNNPIEWYNDPLTNPCFAAGTMVLTRDGHYPIESLVGKTVEVWDGENWVEIDNFRVTAKNQAVYTVYLRSGKTITATAYHSFILKDDTRKELRYLVEGDELLTHNLGFDGEFINEKSNVVRVVEFSHVADEVYCCTVPTNHSFALSNGIQIGQCHEINLTTGRTKKAVSFCNLSTLPLTNFVVDGWLKKSELIECLKLNVRINLRQTCVEFPYSEWTETQSDERLLGVSLTGFQDAMQLLGWKTNSVEIENFLTELNKVANDEATSYSQELGLPRPLLVCTIKPEGTSSQIYGCSDGLHWDWSPYYIRRVRMTSKDALAKSLLTQGFTAYPETYDLVRHFDNTDVYECIRMFQDLSNDKKLELLDSANTIVFEFPVKSFSKITRSSVSAIEQLDNVKAFTEFYTDHMPSSTITVKDDEWDDVAKWVNNNWDSYITASFLPYYGASYPLLPYEAISEETYQEMVSKIPDESKSIVNGRVTFKVNPEILNQIERKLDSQSLDDVVLSDCDTGMCPVR